ncbi:hypothetical protein Tco_0226315 [Tanacetum coccineum]
MVISGNSEKSRGHTPKRYLEYFCGGDESEGGDWTVGLWVLEDDFIRHTDCLEVVTEARGHDGSLESDEYEVYIEESIVEDGMEVVEDKSAHYTGRRCVQVYDTAEGLSRQLHDNSVASMEVDVSLYCSHKCSQLSGDGVGLILSEHIYLSVYGVTHWRGVEEIGVMLHRVHSLWCEVVETGATEAGVGTVILMTVSQQWRFLST